MHPARPRPAATSAHNSSSTGAATVTVTHCHTDTNTQQARKTVSARDTLVACVTGVSACKKNATLKNFFSRLFRVVAEGLINFFYVVFFFWPAYSVTCFNSFDNDDGSNDNIRKSKQSTWYVVEYTDQFTTLTLPSQGGSTTKNQKHWKNIFSNFILTIHLTE